MERKSAVGGSACIRKYTPRDGDGNVAFDVLPEKLLSSSLYRRIHRRRSPAECQTMGERGIFVAQETIATVHFAGESFGLLLPTKDKGRVVLLFLAIRGVLMHGNNLLLPFYALVTPWVTHWSGILKEVRG